jgi:hypothetical protein
MRNGQVSLIINCLYKYIKWRLLRFWSSMKYLYTSVNVNDSRACYIKLYIILILTDQIHCIEKKKT